VAGYRITTRRGSRVERERAEDLGAALAALERGGRELERDASSHAVGGRLMRRFEPVQQVIGRVEIAGPRRLRAGVDVRGDGSAEAYTGRIGRRLVAQRDGESPYEALRRELGAQARAAPG
jgi:hypothetical protein